MKTVVRVAVSLRKSTLAELDRATRKAKRSRSAMVNEAVERYLHDESPSDRDKRYIEAYRRHPEAGTSEDAAVTAAVETWDEWK